MIGAKIKKQITLKTAAILIKLAVGIFFIDIIKKSGKSAKVCNLTVTPIKNSKSELKYFCDVNKTMAVKPRAIITESICPQIEVL